MRTSAWLTPSNYFLASHPQCIVGHALRPRPFVAYCAAHIIYIYCDLLSSHSSSKLSLYFVFLSRSIERFFFNRPASCDRALLVFSKKPKSQKNLDQNKQKQRRSPRTITHRPEQDGTHVARREDTGWKHISHKQEGTTVGFHAHKTRRLFLVKREGHQHTFFLSVFF